MEIPLSQFFTFFFLMLGPFKIIGPFAQMTQNADGRLARQIAFRAIIVSTLALLLAAFLGESFLEKYKIPLPVLGLAAGIILFLVALQSVLRQFEPVTASPKEVVTPTHKMAISPLAFPTIVTPHGIAILIVTIALYPDLQSQLKIATMLLEIMALNLIVMLAVRPLLRFLGLTLQILGAVLGIIQVALGLQIIFVALQKLSAMPH